MMCSNCRGSVKDEFFGYTRRGSEVTAYCCSWSCFSAWVLTVLGQPAGTVAFREERSGRVP